MLPTAQMNKGGIPGSRTGLRNPALPNALTLMACVDDDLHPRSFFGVEQNYWAQRVRSGSEDAGWNNKSRPVGKQQYYWEDTGSYLSSFRNYLSANDLLVATPDELERIYPALENTSYSSFEFFDLQQYNSAGPRHKWVFLTGDVTSSFAGIDAWNNTKLNGTEITYIAIPNNTSTYMEVKWIGLNDEIGGPYTVLKHDTIIFNKNGDELGVIGNVNTIYLDATAPIGFDTQYLEDAVTGTDVLRLQFRVGYRNGIGYNLAGRDFTLRVKVVVEIIEVNNVQKV
jgi:hypothetical protein